MRVALVLALTLVAPGCVTGTWTTWRAHRAPGGLGEPGLLVPGETDLEGALTHLGAPLVVRENGAGAVLAWGWARETQWGVTVDVPVSDADASFTYSRTRLGLKGIALFFDGDWILTHARRGALSKVLPPAQKRASSVEFQE